MCPSSQECFDFGATFPIGSGIFQTSYPKLQFLTCELLGILVEMGYKIGRLYFTTLL